MGWESKGYCTIWGLVHCGNFCICGLSTCVGISFPLP